MNFFDGHNDTLMMAEGVEGDGVLSFLQGRDSGHLDLPRARSGSMMGGVFAVFVNAPKDQRRAPPPADDSGRPPDMDLAPPLDASYALNQTLQGAARLFRLEKASQGRVRVIRRFSDFEKSHREGAFAAVLHFEGAEAIDENLAALEVFYQTGLRSLGLVWSRPNIFATGVPFRFNHDPNIGPGLTDAGKELVRVCNRMGIVIDLSHLNAKGFWDVAGLSQAPLVASHSNAFALCPVTRNLTDAQLDAVARSGGIVGINFCEAFLRPDGRETNEPGLCEIVRHARYLTERIGIDHVGLGSDFDGARIPADLPNVAAMPLLFDALRRGGFGEDDLEKIGHRNWLRVFRETWVNEDC